MLCDHHLTTIAGHLLLFLMAEQGIPSVKLTDPNYRAVIDKFILSNYNNSICDLNIFCISYQQYFNFFIYNKNYSSRFTAVLHVC
jgi:hypothetical protein